MEYKKYKYEYESLKMLFDYLQNTLKIENISFKNLLIECINKNIYNKELLELLEYEEIDKPS